MIVLRVNDKYGLPVQTATARKTIAKALLDDPNARIEAFTLVGWAALEPTATDRAKARAKKAFDTQKFLDQQAGNEVRANQLRLAEIEAEAARLRLRLGVG